MPGHPGTPPTLPSSFSGSSPTFLGTRVVRLRGTLPGRLYPGYPRGKPTLKKIPIPSVTASFPTAPGAAPAPRGCAAPPGSAAPPGGSTPRDAVAAGSCSHVGPPAPHGNGGGGSGGPGRAVSMAVLPPSGAGLCSPCDSPGCTLRVPPLGHRARGPPDDSRPLRPIVVPMPRRGTSLHPGPPRHGLAL